jgi:2-oxo-4-hydroxy-4-carboxy--5-ureidoimidazoline (OHCU) decarboxylase
VSLTLERLNALPRLEAAEQLRACCGSSRWVEAMLDRRPFESLDQLVTAAGDVWLTMNASDWDEAFAHHPRIGEGKAAAAVSPVAREWSAREQGTAAGSDASTRGALARANQDLLADLESRMGNDPDQERAVAAEEQRKITRLRLLALMGAREP